LEVEGIYQVHHFIPSQINSWGIQTPCPVVSENISQNSASLISGLFHLKFLLWYCDSENNEKSLYERIFFHSSSEIFLVGK